MVCVADGTDLAAAEARARAHRRPGHGRDAPRRRRLRAGASRSPSERGVRDPDGRGEATRERPRDRRRSATRCCASARARSRADELRSPEVQRLIDDMIDTMRAADGAGLAANQVGEPRADRRRRGRPQPALPLQAADPAHGGRQPGDRAARRRAVEINEGCLSVPDLRGDGRAPRRRCACATSIATASRTTRSARPDRRDLPARGRPPRRRALPRPRRRPAHAHDLGAVRAPPPRRVRRAHHRVRRARSGS